jgi:hypothetical protein
MSVLLRFLQISHIFTPDSEACQKLAAQKELRHCTVNMTQFHLNRTVKETVLLPFHLQ